MAFVHMGSEEEAKAFFARYGLADVARISDPEAKLYRQFGLKRGNWWQLLGPTVWWRGFQSFILSGHKVGKLVGDGFQMPGVFLVDHSQLIREFRHDTSADRPDYEALVVCPVNQANL